MSKSMYICIAFDIEGNLKTNIMKTYNSVILKASEMKLLKEHFTESYYNRFFKTFDVFCCAFSGYPGYFYEIRLDRNSKSRSRVLCLIRMISICAGNVRKDRYLFFKLLVLQSKIVKLLVRV